MGQEIKTSRFTDADFADFRERLAQETDLLRDWFSQRRFESVEPTGGFELETCLVDRALRPAPVNETFLERLGSDLVVPELARFNVEINTPPRALHAGALDAMHENLAATWKRCNAVARTLDAELLMVGILPTLCDGDLTVEHMSGLERYRALNEQVLRLRQGHAITLDIEGAEHLTTTHYDVMLEAAATSFQIHLQVPEAQAVRFYNAAVVLSAPMVALSANSPFLFGRDLWDETRIPLFEQAVAVSRMPKSRVNRVTLGSDYMHASLMECFQENLNNFAILLPMLMDAQPEALCHLRLQNGTIWRWNRPLVGLDDAGTPQLRLEHRVVPAGPSLVDTIANAAFFFGAVHALATADEAPETRLAFEHAQANFYAAARHGLRASLVWLHGGSVPAHTLLLEQLLPAARRGLEHLELSADEIETWLGIVEARLRTGRHGTAWQRAYAARHGRDMQRLATAYRDHQRSGAPVHEWEV